MLFYATLVIVTILYSINQIEVTSIKDALLLAGYGTSLDYFNFISYLSYIVIFYGFVFFIQIYLSNEISRTGYFRLIRISSINRWAFILLQKIIIVITLFLLALFLSIILLSYLYDLSLTGSTFDISLYKVIYNFFINSFLQILFYVLLSVIIVSIFKEMFYSFIVLIVLSLFMLPYMNSYLIIPSGLNSSGYLLNGNSLYSVTILLLIYIAIEISIIYYLLNKKDFSN